MRLQKSKEAVWEDSGEPVTGLPECTAYLLSQKYRGEEFSEMIVFVDELFSIAAGRKFVASELRRIRTGIRAKIGKN